MDLLISTYAHVLVMEIATSLAADNSSLTSLDILGLVQFFWIFKDQLLLDGFTSLAFFDFLISQRIELWLAFDKCIEATTELNLSVAFSP